MGAQNPATGKFFVGTKSVFNKKKIKINDSHSDIDANHSGDVADILHRCLIIFLISIGLFKVILLGLVVMILTAPIRLLTSLMK